MHTCIHSQGHFAADNLGRGIRVSVPLSRLFQFPNALPASEELRCSFSCSDAPRLSRVPAAEQPQSCERWTRRSGTQLRRPRAGDKPRTFWLGRIPLRRRNRHGGLFSPLPRYSGLFFMFLLVSEESLFMCFSISVFVPKADLQTS